MLYSRIKGVAALKNIRQFLKKHTVALLLLAVALTLSTGTLWAKYAQNVTVTNGLNLTVTVQTKDYTIDKSKMQTALKGLATKPSTLMFIKGDDAALDGLTCIANIEASNSGPIGLYQTADKKTAYIAPSDGSSAVMYAPSCWSFLDGSISDGDGTGLKNSLQTLDLSNLDTSRMTDMKWMFAYNSVLTSINFGNFNTSKVSRMESMFAYCYALRTLDLSSFDTASVTNMKWMFRGSSKLTTIVVDKFDTGKASTSTDMFSNCSSLKGGAGTKYSSSNVDKTYARIDGGTASPGYFTAKTAASNAKTVSLDLSGLTKITASTADDTQQTEGGTNAGTTETTPSLTDAPDTKTVLIDPRELNNITVDRAA